MNCYIVGKGASLMNITKDHFGEGIIITINSAIAKVESLELPNLTFALCKDGASPDYINECPLMECHICPYGFIYPQKAILVLHKHESMECMPDYFPKMIIDAEQYGLNWRNESVLLAIEFGIYLGCDEFIFISFDAVTNGSDYSINPDGSVHQFGGMYTVQAERLIQRCITLNHKFIEPNG